MGEGKYKNKYRTKSHRHETWDYSKEGFYFVTICIKNFKKLFGKIINEKINLSSQGLIAENFWKEIPKHFNNVVLHEFVIMPNHIHGIIEINLSNIRRDEALPRLEYEKSNFLNNIRRDEALPRLYEGKFPEKSLMSPKPGSLSVIIGSFKSITTKTINKEFSNINFAWQANYYDRIIRNENEFNKIREYILNNPLKWHLDKYNLD